MTKKFKRILSVLLAMLTVFSAVPIAGINLALKASAAELQSSGWITDTISYNFDEDTGTLTISGTGDMPDYGYNYNESPFYEDDSIKSVIIEYGVTSIGNYAFEFCIDLVSIEIPDSVTSIGEGAFEYCTGLTSITIPDSVTSIGDLAFFSCESLTSITIPDSVTSIGESAFESCTSLTSITIPDSVTSIDWFTFYKCTALESVIIPDSVISIGDAAFQECSSLESITIPDSVTSIGYAAFADCSNLESITIGNSVTSIGDSAFACCDNLESITIPDSVTSIGDRAFAGCNNLESITIGNSVTSIGECAFENCTKFASITVDENNSVYDSRNNCNAIIETATNTLFFGCKNTTIPDSVTSIGESAFYNCDSLTSITIPFGVTSIGDRAFSDCYVLTSVKIPDSVTSIGDYAFAYCENLTSIEIPDSVTSIGNEAFYVCTSLTSIEIPDSVTSIGESAFESCTSLTSITILDSVTSIGDYAFAYCYRLTSITIGSGVTSIGDYAFAYCYRLTSITIGSDVTSIGDYAFEYCTGLTSITIGSGVTSIGESAFEKCDSLKDVYYSGTQEQWNAITVGKFNENLLNAAVHFPMITVILNPQGGSVTPSSVQVEAGESAALPEATRTGFTFLGWSADSSAKTGKMTYKPAGDTTLYAIWKLDSGKLDDSDFYSFANTAAGFGCDTYTVSDGDFEKLAGYVMTQYGESSEITKNTISMLRSEKDKPWRGSCYGMAAAIMLDKLGRIGFNENFDTDAPAMYDVDSPIDNPDVLSAINYYQLSQFLGFIKPNISFSRSRNWTGGLRNLVQLSKQDSGFMFIYNYENAGSTLAHAIIIRGYAAEDDSFYYLNAYDSRSPVQDITVQVAKDYSDCAVLGENSTEEPVQIELMTEFSGFDAVDIDGPDNDMILKPEVSAIISDSTVLSVLAFGDVTITNADGETITVSDGDVSGTMDIISDKIIVNNSENGAPAFATLSFEVADSEYFNFESTAENMSVSVLNGSIYASVETKNADSIVIAQDEGVSIDGENAEYKVCLTLDDDYCDMIKLEGTADNGVDISFKDNGVEVSGVQNDTCRLTSYSGLTDEEKFEFSSDDSEIIITSGKTGIDVLSKDANGAYTSSLINKLKVKVNGLNLMHKEEGRIRTIITNADAKKCSYAYSSSNPGVAEVDNEGNITTKAPGKTTITCIVADENGRTAESTCTVKVKFTFWQWIIWLLFLGFLRL